MKKILNSFLILSISLAVLLSLGGFSGIPQAGAASILGGENVNVTQKQDQNVYAAGAQIIVANDLKKDLLAAGANISLNSKIGQDVLAAGSDVRVNNAVGDDLRVAAGNVNLDGKVGGDLMAFAGTVNTSSDSVVDGDAIIMGGQIIINGNLRGSAIINGANVVINGKILGNAEIRAGQITINGELAKKATLSADTIVLGDQASFGDGVRYYASSGEIDFGQRIKHGEAVFDKGLAFSTSSSGHAKKSFAKMGLWFLISLLAAALVMLVFLVRPTKKMTERVLRDAADFINTKFWKSLLAGLLFFIVLPIIGVLLSITVVGLPLGLAALAVFAFSVYLSPIIAALVFGRWLQEKTKSEWGMATYYFVSLGLFVVLKLLHLIPFVGGLIVLVIALVGFGATLKAKKEVRKKLEAAL